MTRPRASFLVALALIAGFFALAVVATGDLGFRRTEPVLGIWPGP